MPPSSFLEHGLGRDVHMCVAPQSISPFIDNDRSALVCFRCGEVGHVRQHCLSHKVKLCYHHERGACRDEHCTYAHGEKELRTPWRPRCIRVVRVDGQLVCIGCNSTEHTFRRCPLQKDMLAL